METYKLKKISTDLNVRLMSGKTVKNALTDFFGGKTPLEISKKLETKVSLYGSDVPYEVYKKLSGCGASRDLLEQFKFEYKEKYCVDGRALVKSINKIVPFDEPDGIVSEITVWCMSSLNPASMSGFVIVVETRTHHREIKEDKLREVNKANARKLRRYLVSLPSVQGVPYHCEYMEDETKREACLV